MSEKELQKELIAARKFVRENLYAGRFVTFTRKDSGLRTPSLLSFERLPALLVSLLCLWLRALSVITPFYSSLITLKAKGPLMVAKWV
jgi:hypothetical protein